MRFEYLGNLDAPMNLLYYCIRFCLNNYGDLIKELYETKKLKKIFQFCYFWLIMKNELKGIYYEETIYKISQTPQTPVTTASI